MTKEWIVIVEHDNYDKSIYYMDSLQEAMAKADQNKGYYVILARRLPDNLITLARKEKGT